MICRNGMRSKCRFRIVRDASKSCAFRRELPSICATTAAMRWRRARSTGTKARSLYLRRDSSSGDGARVDGGDAAPPLTVHADAATAKPTIAQIISSVAATPKVSAPIVAITANGISMFASRTVNLPSRALLGRQPPARLPRTGYRTRNRCRRSTDDRALP